MKIDIVQRKARKKDFWDLDELLEKYSIEQIIALHKQRYPHSHDEKVIRQKLTKEIDGWLLNRLKYCIWEDWKKPDRRRKNLIRLGIRNGQAYAWSRTRMGGWAVAQKSYFRNNDHTGQIGQERLRVHAVLLRTSISTI